MLVSIVFLSLLVPTHVLPGQKIAFDNPFGVTVVDSEVKWCWSSSARHQLMYPS
jgi:hypothetical protein